MAGRLPNRVAERNTVTVKDASRVAGARPYPRYPGARQSRRGISAGGTVRVTTERRNAGASVSKWRAQDLAWDFRPAVLVLPELFLQAGEPPPWRPDIAADRPPESPTANCTRRARVEPPLYVQNHQRYQSPMSSDRAHGDFAFSHCARFEYGSGCAESGAGQSECAGKQRLRGAPVTLVRRPDLHALDCIPTNEDGVPSVTSGRAV
jgi:hypothetical protein